MMAKVIPNIKTMFEKESYSTAKSLFIFDENGNRLCETGTRKLSETERMVLELCLKRQTIGNYQIEIDGTNFLCFSNTLGMLIGKGNFNSSKPIVKSIATKPTPKHISERVAKINITDTRPLSYSSAQNLHDDIKEDNKTSRPSNKTLAKQKSFELQAVNKSDKNNDIIGYYVNKGFNNAGCDIENINVNFAKVLDLDDDIATQRSGTSNATDTIAARAASLGTLNNNLTASTDVDHLCACNVDGYTIAIIGKPDGNESFIKLLQTIKHSFVNQ